MGKAGWAWVALLMLVLSALAGCMADDGSEETNGSIDPAENGEQEGVEDPEQPPLIEDPVTMTLYLSADGRLVDEAPSAGHFPQGDFLGEYFQGDIDADDWAMLSDPLLNATMVHPETVTLTLWVQSDTPHVPFPGFEGVGGGGWFGSTKSMPLNTFDLTDPVFMPGDPVEYVVLLEFNDYVPIVIPAGESFSLLPVFVAVTTDATPARILVGGDHASSITFTMSNLTKDPAQGLSSSIQSDTFEGTIESSEDPRPVHAFDLQDETTELHVEIRYSGGGHESDLDIDLYDARGRHVSGSHTPSTYESIYLLGPALEGLHGTTLTVEVVHFTPVNAQYEVTVHQR